MAASEIARLKRKARILYKKYVHSRDDLSCGHELAAYIRPDIQKTWNVFMKVMEELQSIDPAYPTNWPMGN